MKHVLRTAVLSVFVLQAAVACATQANDQKSSNPDAKVLGDFNERVKAYIDLRKKADDGVPPLKETEDPAKIKIAQTELAKRSKINNVQISKLERGITRDITGATLRALCKALGVSPSYILGMSDDLDSELLTTVGV